MGGGGMVEGGMVDGEGCGGRAEGGEGAVGGPSAPSKLADAGARRPRSPLYSRARTATASHLNHVV